MIQLCINMNRNYGLSREWLSVDAPLTFSQIECSLNLIEIQLIESLIAAGLIPRD